MDNRILEIVFYLIDLFRENESVAVDESTASVELKNLGYSEDEISQAYTLITRSSEFSGETLFSAFPKNTASIRLLTSEERYRLSHEAQSFLLKLAHLGIISREQLEGILETALNSGMIAVDIEDIKQITSGVLMDDKSDNKSFSFVNNNSERLH